MTKPTIQDATKVARIDHHEAMQIATVENERFGDLCKSLGPDDWSKPTDCALWDVRAVAAHVIGSAAGQASVREFVRQARGGRPLRVEIGGTYWWDGMNELQVRERAGKSTDELIAEWDRVSVEAVRARERLPRPISRLRLIKFPDPIGRQPVAYLFDVGFTRDTWMHRIDMARATAKALDLRPGHDGRIVADIVAEWASTHHEPFTLELEGPAGGQFGVGDGGEHVRIDAIEFCRILAERAEGTGVLRHQLPL